MSDIKLFRMDHGGEFEVLVWKTLGKDQADAIDWSTTRLLCIASDFTKYDSTHSDRSGLLCLTPGSLCLWQNHMS